MDHAKPLRRSITLRQPGAAGEGAKKPAAVKCGEVMGGKTAECAAICCCCPFALIDLVVLTVVKLPAGLCRKAMRKRSSRIRRRRMVKEAKAVENKSRKGELGADGGGSHCYGKEVEAPAGGAELREKNEDEMWARFHAGFWRSRSQDDNNQIN